MANSINYATQYQRMLAQAYPWVLHFGKLFTTPNNELYKPVDAKTIKIPAITVTGRKDGDRDNLKGIKRNHSNTWETKELANHRYWSTLIHPLDMVQTNAVLNIQNITKVFNEEEKFPEKDRYLISKLFDDWTAAGKTAANTALTAENILSKIDDEMERQDEKLVPADGRLMYVIPTIHKLIKQASEKYRFLTATEGVMSRTVHRIDEVEVIPVPSLNMKTVYDFTEGSKPGVGANQINMFFAHQTAVLTPEIYSYAGYDSPSTLTEGKYFYYEEAFEDVFILEKRTDAISFVISE